MLITSQHIKSSVWFFRPTDTGLHGYLSNPTRLPEGMAIKALSPKCALTRQTSLPPLNFCSCCSRILVACLASSIQPSFQPPAPVFFPGCRPRSSCHFQICLVLSNCLYGSISTLWCTVLPGLCFTREFAVLQNRKLSTCFLTVHCFFHVFFLGGGLFSQNTLWTGISFAIILRFMTCRSFYVITWCICWMIGLFYQTLSLEAADVLWKACYHNLLFVNSGIWKLGI